MPEGLETLTGTVERVTFHNEESGFAILRVSLAKRREPITVKGRVATIQPGEGIRAVGEWINDATYGRQFAAEEIETMAPGSLEGIERYLGSGLIEGIGPKYAQRLVKKFGEKIFDVIDTESARLQEVEGIGEKRRREIKASWEQQKAVREIMVFLHRMKVGTSRAVRIYKTYGDQSLAKIQENPYRLAEDVWGIGFKTADDIAARMGMARNAPERLRAGLLFALQKAADEGHCALPETLLIDEAVALLNDKSKSALEEESSEVTSEALKPELLFLLAQATLFADERTGTRLIYQPHLLTAEKESADRLKALASLKPEYPQIDAEKALAWVETKTGKTLAEGQKAAIREALHCRVLVITGGPGVGKTTILNSFLQIVSAKGVDFMLAAPTGRAAKRMSESTGHEAKTLHRLLEYQPAKGWGRNETRPLQGTLFVLDEVSMVDISLLWHFLKALPPEAHLVMVGDVDQLPSVGPGAVLSDIISSGAVPVARLTEIFRQAQTSRIITAAHAINRGFSPDLSPPPSGETSDFFFIERETPEDIATTIAHVIRDRLPQRFGFHPINEIQVLAPMNRGLLGTASMNQRLQQELNAPKEFTLEAERFGVLYRTGDKVIQLRNNYDKDVFNGDIGRITHMESEPLRLKVTFDDGREASYEAGELDELRLAYAITIHKSQGSEFPAVVIPVSTQHYVMLQRNLIYTGLTRGKKVVVLVGQKKALEMAVRNADALKRWTGLKERLSSG